MFAFSMKALYAAMDAERRRRGLSWVELAAEMNKPFAYTTSIPVHPATLRDIEKKSSVTSAVVLQVLRWLGATPESFLDRPEGFAKEEEALPDAGPDRILRFDTRAMYEALNEARLHRGMSWKEVAGELQGFSPSMLTNLVQGPLIGFPRVMQIPQWLGVPAARFVRARSR